MALNTSTAKQNYSFGRANRFGTARTVTNVLFYDKKDLFTKTDSTSNQGRVFQKSTRFSYYHSPDKQAKFLPSPDKYNLPGLFGKEFIKNNAHAGTGKNNMYSFGVSRQNM